MSTSIPLHFALALLGLGLSGCASHAGKPAVGGPDAEEAAIRFESSRREYYDCIRNEEPGKPLCDSLEDLYKRNREAYESMAK